MSRQQQLPDRRLAWPIPWPAVELIAKAEGLRLKAYLCPAGVWTIGWGETSGIQPGDVRTKPQADAQLCHELTRYRDEVLAMCRRPPTANELGALVSLAYNIGLPALRKSTVLRQFNAGNAQAAARAFGLWNKARVNGVLQPLAGLTARRAAEAALFLSPGHDEAYATPLPQAVAAESHLAASPIAQSGAVTAGTGAVALLSSATDQASQASSLFSTAHGLAATVSTSLGVSPQVLLGVVLLGAGAAVMYWRIRQRSEGFA